MNTDVSGSSGEEEEGVTVEEAILFLLKHVVSDYDKARLKAAWNARGLQPRFPDRELTWDTTSEVRAPAWDDYFIVHVWYRAKVVHRLTGKRGWSR